MAESITKILQFLGRVEGRRGLQVSQAISQQEAFPRAPQQQFRVELEDFDAQPTERTGPFNAGLTKKEKALLSGVVRAGLIRQ
jgi:hypothetical protein